VKKIILLGSGGQAKSCIEVINSKKLFKVSGLITNSKEKNFQNIKILGDNNYLENLKNKRKINLHIAIGFISSPKLRIKLFFNFKKMNFKFPVIIAKSAIVSKNSNILDGTIVHHGAFINNGARIGFNTIINSLAVIEHDVEIGNNCHVSTGAILNGDVVVGDNTFIGSGAKVKQGVKIGKNCIIGMGVNLKKDLRNNTKITT
tara:strand:- start:4162 stop:4770 length:609 start_codon:yes stop_codon:yes gene_type:complete